MSITLTLKFKTLEEADYVYGQLSDGWGENEVNLGPRKGPSEARVVTCKPIGEYWEHHLRMRQKLPKVFDK